MTEASFRQLYQEMNNQWGQAAKMTKAREVFNNSSYYFTTAQARQLILLLNSEANRLELAKLSYDNVVDRENFTQLYDVLNRQASRNELDTYVRNNSYRYNDPYSSNPTNTYRTPMSDASFTTLYNNIRKKWLPGAKMSAAADAFNLSTNYFTTAQARKIIALVSSESNRLELAKLSYDNITDPANFRQLYDLLNSQASRDELDNYIRTNYNAPY